MRAVPSASRSVDAASTRPPVPALRHARAVTACFVLTTFVASGLLFAVQPMFARMVLPRLGGSPAVWTTCVLFFQSALLVGYAYAHLSSRWLDARRQAAVHVLAMLGAAVTLPLGVGPSAPPAGSDPAWWLLAVLAVRLGPTFLVLSMMAPMIQRWYASLPVPSAQNPYFLYAASNAGSLAALVAYPFVIEPLAGLRVQTLVWSAGFAGLLLLVIGCRLLLPIQPPATVRSEPAGVIDWPTKAWWVVLGAIPSSLLLAVTTHISTDLAAVPLLWVVPLAAYLLTFIIAFGAPGRRLTVSVARTVAPLSLAAVLASAFQLNQPGFAVLHLVTFFAGALCCHLVLAQSRPVAGRLTDFYLWMSLGGVIGGGFNTFVAPHVFAGIFEYPLSLAAVCLVRPRPAYRGSAAEPTGFIAAVAAVPLALSILLWALGQGPANVPLPSVVLVAAVVPAAVLAFANRRAPFNTLLVLMVAGLISGSTARSVQGDVLFAGRSFFGVSRVLATPDGEAHVLQHGSTLHGQQRWPPAETCEPLAYYAVDGPVGDVMAIGPFARAAVVGLGSGAMACYVPDQGSWRFFEIDPLVERVARTEAWFTYLRQAPGGVAVELGDGRQGLATSAADSFELIVLDAFSSDSVPVHLITREALVLYLSRLREHGVLALHVSNRYVELEPVVQATLEGLSAAALGRFDEALDGDGRSRVASHWIVVARDPARLAPLVARGWRPLRGRPGVHAWTDDYSNLARSINW